MSEVLWTTDGRTVYVPIAVEGLEELKCGIEPVRLQLRDGQFWITRLEEAQTLSDLDSDKPVPPDAVEYLEHD